MDTAKMLKPTDVFYLEMHFGGDTKYVKVTGKDAGELILLDKEPDDLGTSHVISMEGRQALNTLPHDDLKQLIDGANLEKLLGLRKNNDASLLAKVGGTPAKVVNHYSRNSN